MREGQGPVGPGPGAGVAITPRQLFHPSLPVLSQPRGAVADEQGAGRRGGVLAQLQVPGLHL